MFEPITGSASSTRTVSKALPVMVVPRIVGESPSSTYHREAVIAEVCSQEAARVAVIRKSGGLRRHVIGHRHIERALGGASGCLGGGWWRR